VIIIEIDQLKGSFVNYTWDFGDNYTTVTHESDYITHQYKYVGKFAVGYHNIMLYSYSVL